ncbi:hypothetical protein TNCV_406601 [Trichonephila clavipes]|nr:hypothetical protein TNCV_406601 [Trichonephila clavipes]
MLVSRSILRHAWTCELASKICRFNTARLFSVAIKSGWSMQSCQQTLDHLVNIRRVGCFDIRPQMLEKSHRGADVQIWTTSEPIVAVLCQKSYLYVNATRVSLE